MYSTALKLLKKINQNGFKSYIIGGFPRDMYLGLKSIDIDICTNATPMQLKEIFANSMISNEQYGSVTIIINKIHFEITTFRKEIEYTNNRIPSKFYYIDSLEEDLKRRDFKINTLCIDENGNLIDLLNAKEDLDNKIISIVGEQQEKLKQDALRILRAIRFATVLNFKLNDDLKEAIIKYRYLLLNLSYFRKRQEIDRILTSSNKEYGLKLIDELGLGKYLEINTQNLVLTDDILGMWSQLNYQKYPFSKNEKQIISKINELKNKDVLDKYNLYVYGLYISSIVGQLKGINRSEITTLYNNLPIYKSKEIAVNIMDICDILKVKPNKHVKDIYNNIEKQIIYGKIENNYSDIKEYIITTL